jgi:hypothetical protein
MHRRIAQSVLSIMHRGRVRVPLRAKPRRAPRHPHGESDTEPLATLAALRKDTRASPASSNTH